MKFYAIVLAVILLCCSGCMYHGNLKENFYPQNSSSDKLPIKAILIFDKTLEGFTYHAENIFFAHGVNIATMPGLKAAMNSAFGATFDELHIADRIDLQRVNDYDIVVIPRIQIIGNVITVSVMLKEARTDNLIRKYSSSGNVYTTVPTSVHTLGIINIIPFAGLATPIVTPLITEIIGGQAEKDLASVLRYSLGTITDDIKSDRNLVSRFKR